MDNGTKLKAIDGADHSGHWLGYWIGWFIRNSSKLLIFVVEVLICGGLTFLAAGADGIKDGVKGTKKGD